MKDKGQRKSCCIVVRLPQKCTETWFRYYDTESNINTLSQDAYGNTAFKRKFDLKAMISTREFAYKN